MQVLSLALTALWATSAAAGAPLNTRPIIGILTQVMAVWSHSLLMNLVALLVTLTSLSLPASASLKCDR